MEMILDLAGAVGGMLTVLVIWFGFQAFIRRGSACRSSPDVLDFMKNGCAGCHGDKACHNRSKEKGSPS